jgi:hypothetical protein
MRTDNSDAQGDVAMDRRVLLTTGLAAGLAGVAVKSAGAAVRRGDRFTSLFDGSSLKNWRPIGDANWALADGEVTASRGKGFLVSTESFADFEVEAEFWIDPVGNSGIFLRCSDPLSVSAENAYEVNIADMRADPTFGTGAIVGYAPVTPHAYSAGGRWNTYRITARGEALTAVLNGVTTARVKTGKYRRGPLALQYAGGLVKFRNVRIRTFPESQTQRGD